MRDPFLRVLPRPYQQYPQRLMKLGRGFSESASWLAFYGFLPLTSALLASLAGCRSASLYVFIPSNRSHSFWCGHLPWFNVHRSEVPGPRHNSLSGEKQAPLMLHSSYIVSDDSDWGERYCLDDVFVVWAHPCGMWGFLWCIYRPCVNSRAVYSMRNAVQCVYVLGCMSERGCLRACLCMAKGMYSLHSTRGTRGTTYKSCIYILYMYNI